MLHSATILLLRHAEKTGAPGDVELSLKGRIRAQAYVEYLPAVVPARPLAALYCAADDSDSRRPRRTLEPLAAARDLKLHDGWKTADVRAFAEHVRGLDKRHDSVIAICWRHTHIVQLAHALGADPSRVPAEWPADEFAWLVQIEYDADGRVANTQVTNQKLLHGDEREPARLVDTHAGAAPPA